MPNGSSASLPDAGQGPPTAGPSGLAPPTAPPSSAPSGPLLHATPAPPGAYQLGLRPGLPAAPRLHAATLSSLATAQAAPLPPMSHVAQSSMQHAQHMPHYHQVQYREAPVHHPPSGPAASFSGEMDDSADDLDDDDDEGMARSHTPSRAPRGGGKRKAGGAAGNSEADEKTKRRLAQNREAARKSRQRKKHYMKGMEEELNSLRRKNQQYEMDKAGAIAQAVAQAVAMAKAHPTSRRGGAPLARPSEDGGGDVKPGGHCPDMHGDGEPTAASRASEESVQAFWQMAGHADSMQEGAATAVQLAGETRDSFNTWRAKHLATVMSIHRELAAPVESEERLGQLVTEGFNNLMEYLEMKKGAISGVRIISVMKLEHMLPVERHFAWMCGFRPSEACSCVVQKLSRQKTFSSQQRAHLEGLRDLVQQQEGVLVGLYQDLAQQIRTSVGALPVTEPTTQLDLASCQFVSKLDMMRMVLSRADELWQAYLQEASKVLSVRQYALVVTSMMDLSLQLQNLSLVYLQTQQAV